MQAIMLKIVCRATYMGEGFAFPAYMSPYTRTDEPHPAYTQIHKFDPLKLKKGVLIWNCKPLEMKRMEITLTWSIWFSIMSLVDPAIGTWRSWENWSKMHYVAKEVNWYGKIGYFYY